MGLFTSKNYIFLSVLLCVFSSCKKNSSATTSETSQRWFKGNLHTHSYWSDGDEFPEVILNWYKTNGYQFLALSDHNTLAEGDKWITVSEDSIYEQAFQAYLDTYGEEWVTYHIDSGRTQVKLKTYEEYRNKVESPGEFIVIRSEEITDRFEDKHIHMNATNIQNKIEPMGGNSVAEVLQNNLNQVLDQRKATGVPMIPHINHPNFYYSIDLEDMIALDGERFFEVYNGHPMVHNMGDSTHISTEEMWDLINISYLEKGKPLMYGLATDDSHSYHTIGEKWSNAGRGWVMVEADTLLPSALINSLEAGKFYSSTGVNLKKLQYKEGTLSIEVAPEENVDYKIVFVGCKKGQTTTEELKIVNGTSAEYALDDDIRFVRCKITSSKLQENPIEDLRYEMAWTQPILPVP
ncbi:PHP domain-containing protein [Pareuzebyella sediminis]|uniref:PHP domain-containing protein n=1 Tax=Pareuzebyella sediminis TaxID=2607998 RepID=UPI0011EC93AA|nr:histidinol-phosphatase [Pareuzebyella sediminis]